MTYNEIKELIRSRSEPDVIVGENTQAPQPYLIIKTESIAAVCQELFSNPQTYFDYLACITGLDNGPEVGTLEVIYNLYSIPYDHHLTLKVITPRLTPEGNLPEVPTISHIWRTADWHEREAYDLVGISFTGHPDLRRILCAHDWEGHPLRRDYEWPEYYHGIKVRYDNHNEVNGFKSERFTGFGFPDNNQDELAS